MSDSLSALDCEPDRRTLLAMALSLASVHATRSFVAGHILKPCCSAMVQAPTAPSHAVSAAKSLAEKSAECRAGHCRRAAGQHRGDHRLLRGRRDDGRDRAAKADDRDGLDRPRGSSRRVRESGIPRDDLADRIAAMVPAYSARELTSHAVVNTSVPATPGREPAK